LDTDLFDNLEITFNDAIGQFKSADGKQINFGKKVQWKLNNLIMGGN